MTTIGEEFGGRDHSTVVYAVQQVEKNMKKDSKTKAMVRISSKISGTADFTHPGG